MLKTFDYNKMPIVEAVNEIMVDAAKRGASDIHFDPLENVMKIRIRIDGALIDYALVPNDIKKNLITRIKIIAGMNITESRLPQDGAIKATVQGTNLDLRVSTIPTNMGEKIVIRILDYSLSGAGIENLGFSEKNYKKVIEMINQPNGIILVTGATGTGKSTTVYAVLQRLNKESTNIITVEDPVEMNIEGVNQIQANSEIGLDFATALRSILRQDPNIIMIGEIRDTETAKIAIRASITGHLVLSTLHTNDSLNTIERLLDMDVERYLLASSLSGIISQRLARRLCPHCRIERKANKYEEKLFEASLGHKVKKLYSANKAGCEHCHGGFSGRIAIQEVLLINQEIRDAISANKSKEELRDLVYGSDVDSLLQDGLVKVEQGITSMEELLKLIELENENATIARMGMEAAAELGDELEEQIIEDEIKATPINNIEVDESVLEENNEVKEEPVIENNNDSIDSLINDITLDSNTENISNDKKSIEELLSDIEQPAIEEKVVEEPVVEEPVIEEPVIEKVPEIVEPVVEEPTIEPIAEETEDKGIKLFGKKKKNKKNKKEDVVEEVETPVTTDHEIGELSLDKLDNFNFNTTNNDDTFKFDDLKLDNNEDTNNINFDDIKLDDTPVENNDFNNFKFNDIDLSNNEVKEEPLFTPVPPADYTVDYSIDNSFTPDNNLNLDELKLDDNNELKLDDANNLNLDELKLDNKNDFNFGDLKIDDVPVQENEPTINIETPNTDNFNLDDIKLDESKFTNLDDIKETGKLDDDLSGASDDDIMNLFN